MILTRQKICRLVFAILIGACLLNPSPALPAGEDPLPPKKQAWPWKGAFGTFDRAALQRGYQVYSQTCASCHGMGRLRYRNLSELGYNEAEIRALAAQYTVLDGPDDQGEMVERPALPSDSFSNPFPNEKAAAFANGGAIPPDLSLMVKARAGGADYIYSLLTGYEEPPEGKTLAAGQYWNPYIAGHVLAMPPPLFDGMVSYADGSPETVSQYAADVSHFMAWAASPYLEDQKRMGLKVLLFLIVFSALVFASKKKLWSSVQSGH